MNQLLAGAAMYDFRASSWCSLVELTLLTTLTETSVRKWTEMGAGLVIYRLLVEIQATLGREFDFRSCFVAWSIWRKWATSLELVSDRRSR